MNCTHPADLSPLSFGPGLTLGLLMVLGLPTAPRDTAVASAPLPRNGDLLTPVQNAETQRLLETQRAMRAHRALTSSGRP